MKTSFVHLFGALSTVAFSFLAGCAADTAPSDEEPAESDVVGVTDLGELESAIGFEKDVKVNGTWTRTDAALKKGACYAARLGSGAPDPQNWQFRRYKNGAAFFKKLGTGPAAGDERAVACVDLDFNSLDEPLSLDGIGLDVILRNRMGQQPYIDSFVGHRTIKFFKDDVDAIEFQEPGAYCDIAAPDNATPAVIKACEAQFLADGKKAPIDIPTFQGKRILSIEAVNANPSNGLQTSKIDPSVAAIAYAYSLKKGTETNRFSMARDPVGHFVSVTGNVTHYEHLDIVLIETNTALNLYVTPKGSEKTAATSAVASCTRKIDAAVNSFFVCKGI